ncbi:MAG: leucyl aminopeptidase family protein [Planctomycetota bacterium]|nr:leucyl aminopeptidase family protein [Planctomycetota bacterium]
MPTPRLAPVPDLAKATKSGFDAAILVTHDLSNAPAAWRAAIDAQRAIDARAGAQLAVLACDAAPGKRLVIAPTGPVQRDHDDVRRYAEAARNGVRRARDAGARAPLVVLGAPPREARYANAAHVTALAALGSLWEPLEAREARGEAAVEPVTSVGFLSPTAFGARDAAEIEAIEGGLRIARDLCGTDPERMAAPRFAEYVKQAFKGLPVTVRVVTGEALQRDYPLLSAVARASQPVARHRPCVIRLEYEPKGRIERTLLFAGKGLTYDTGGADIKAGGFMAGMSRDKGGAAAVAGLVWTAAKLGLKGVRVVAELGVVRNSIGSEAFVTDEIVTSHAGVRVRIGNTDAEGRLVLADLLSHLRRRAQKEKDARILSVATLTGHAGRAVGPYNIALDNGPARKAGVAESLGKVGDAWGDPFEVSRLRREDFDFVAPRSKADDVLSCNNLPSSGTARGHQFPMAFLAIASGLDQHALDSKAPLAFTHVDIGGSATEGGDWQHGRPTGRPLLALLQALR